jgi:transposase
MTSYGVRYVCKMTTSDYIHIIKTKLAHTLYYYRLGGGEFIFQHDNDPKHTAKITTTYLKEAKYSVLSWPSQSPDLNLIEYMWRHLKFKLALYEQKARGVHELLEKINIEWEMFDRDVCCKYIDSMPTRVQAVNKRVVIGT